MDVLVKVRNFIHEGVAIVSYPLGASVRMLFSPYCSIVVGEKSNKINDFYVEVIENSIIKYKKLMKMRKIDYKNSKSYALMDKELLNSTLRDLKNNCISNII